MKQTPSSSNIEVSVTVDARGERCPMPLLKAKQALNNVQTGDRILVIASDVNSSKDIANFVSLTQHALVASSENAGTYSFYIQKG